MGNGFPPSPKGSDPSDDPDEDGGEGGMEPEESGLLEELWLLSDDSPEELSQGGETSEELSEESGSE